MAANKLSERGLNFYLLVKIGPSYDYAITGMFAYTPDQALELMYRHASRHRQSTKNLLDLYSAVNSGEIDVFGDSALLKFEYVPEVLFSMGKMESLVSFENSCVFTSQSNPQELPLREIAQRLVNRVRATKQGLPIESEIKEFPEKHRISKYKPSGTATTAMKLYREKCDQAMMKFSRNELLEAAKRVNAKVNSKMSKEEICKAINDLYFDPETQPEVIGPKLSTGHWIDEPML